MKITDSDSIYFNSLGISLTEVERQLHLLKRGVLYPHIHAPALRGNGIIILSETEKSDLAKHFSDTKKQYSISRFIPASGAASRMFFSLSAFLKTGETNYETEKFFEHLHEFPFYPFISEKNDRMAILHFLLDGTGLNFENLPKALIPFHINEESIFTALESQLNESLFYAKGKNDTPHTHFTIPENFIEEFELISISWRKNAARISDKVTFSFQKSDTHTVALDENGELLKDEKGLPVVRPGGHGSLLANLNEMEDDILFIRNIDNVVSPAAQAQYIFVHEFLGGLMMQIMELIYRSQKLLDSGEKISENVLKSLEKYFGNINSDSGEIKKFLFRPLRICGMVKNEGEPGGGPFYIQETDGRISLQIIESAQVDKNDPEQLQLFISGTHFNPVDICCSIKNYKGEKYDLKEFAEPDFSFSSQKMYQDKKITILEHPGLWNGSMHNWLTVFVEIPNSVFNPVKTVNDLLRGAHQQ